MWVQGHDQVRGFSTGGDLGLSAAVGDHRGLPPHER